MVAQQFHHIAEPYSVGFYARTSSSEPWSWRYIDHEAYRWRDVVISHEAVSNRVLVNVFNEDGEFTNVIGMTARGRKAIEQFHRPLFEGDGRKGIPSFKNAVFKVSETRIRFIRPDVVNVDVIWTQTGSTLDGKDRGLRRGLMSWVATKEGNKWGVAVMHNMDLLPVERGTAR